MSKSNMSKNNEVNDKEVNDNEVNDNEVNYVKEITLILLFATLLLPNAYAQLPNAYAQNACFETTKTLYVPAIIDNTGSEMVRISVETKSGNGEVFVSVEPAIGFYTQLSERIAAKIAFDITDNRNCDVFLRIHTTEGVNQVDGPSAGAAMTLLVLSALENKNLREDFSITGTIEEDRRIGSVGEIPLKAEATSKFGKNILLVPELTREEKMYLMIIRKYYEIEVIEVNAIIDAINITFSDIMPETKLKMSAEDIKQFPYVEVKHKNVDYFVKINKEMMDNVEKEIETLDENLDENLDGNLDENVKKSFQTAFKTAENAFETGNYYTSANTLFITSIESRFMRYQEGALETVTKELEECLMGFEKKNKSLSNFEYLGPAELRYIWTKDKIESILEENTLSTLEDLGHINNISTSYKFLTPKLKIYDDLLYALEWCKAGKRLNVYPTTFNESYFDEEILKDLANDYLINATEVSLGIDDSEVSRHLRTAMGAFEEKMYMASAIASVYVLSDVKFMELYNNGLEDGLTDGLIESNYSFINDSSKFRYLWPQLYFNHGKTYGEGETSLRLYILATYLENLFNAIDETVIEEISKEGVIDRVIDGIIEEETIITEKKIEDEKIFIGFTIEKKDKYLVLALGPLALITVIILSLNFLDKMGTKSGN